MTVERRYSARHAIALRVHILYGRRRFYSAQARNLSNQGMYITVRNLTLPPGTPLELELDCLGRDWLLDAVVVHRDGSGIGVMFREPQPELYQGLIQAGTSTAESERPQPQSKGAERPRLRRA